MAAGQISIVEANIEEIFQNTELKNGNIKYEGKKLKDMEDQFRMCNV